MKQGISLLSLTVTATAALVSNTFITGAGTIAAAGGNALGVAQSDAAIGNRVTALVKGTAIVLTGAAIPANSLVESDVNGCAVPHNTGVVLGRMCPYEVATAAGAFVEIIPFVN